MMPGAPRPSTTSPTTAIRSRLFPLDEYTPYGYLDNPYDAGPWTGLEAGGVLRSLEACGFGWFHPERDPPAAGGLRVGLEVAGQRLIDTADFRRAGLTLISRYHTSRVQSFDFQLDGLAVSLTFFLASRDALLCRCTTVGPMRGGSALAQAVVGRAARRNARAIHLPQPDAMAVLAEPGPWYALRASRPSAGQAIWDDGRPGEGSSHVVGEAYSPGPGALVGELRLELADGQPEEALWIALGRGASPELAAREASRALAGAGRRLAGRLGEDDRFWSAAPRLTGDWPASWRRGWVHDLETTRLMARPAAGVFQDLWPTWQLFRPRVVLAENALDMMRLGYVDPATARRALTTAFRDAPQANLPCLFANGSLNMVAEGGEACGTSPAWCLPFHSLYLLYLWQPDRAWLEELYPHLAEYLRWWLAHRRDPEGWLVYRCTWESGEDASPRLDRQRTGHRDISREVRPVELQAAMAHSALILARFAEELGRPEGEREAWRAVFREYRQRTRALWDERSARFRDLHPGGASPAGDEYWGVEAESPLQLLPLMYGVATDEQAARLVSRLPDFVRPPYTWWASWSYTVAEAARAGGAHVTAGELAHRVLAVVYPALDRREEADMGARPGTAREWWPEELSRNTVHNEAYGWGATTATLLLRHLLGFGSDPDTRELVFELCPAFPDDMWQPGRSFGVANLHYRGTRLDLTYRLGREALEARLTFDAPRRVEVVREGQAVEARLEGGEVVFTALNGGRHRVRVRGGD